MKYEVCWSPSREADWGIIDMCDDYMTAMQSLREVRDWDEREDSDHEEYCYSVRCDSRTCYYYDWIVGELVGEI